MEPRNSRDVAEDTAYFGSLIAMFILATLSVLLRLYCRWVRGLQLVGDDYTMIGALASLAVTTGTVLKVTNGSYQGYTDIQLSMKLGLVSACMYCVTLALTKISILLLCIRLFPTRKMFVAAVSLACISTAWAVATIFVIVFQCNPVARAWDYDLPGSCMNRRTSLIANAIPNIITDIAILLVPVVAVWRIRASTVERLSLIGLFTLGSCVIYISIYRLIMVIDINHEVEGTFTRAQTWNIYETCAAVLSGNLPTLRPLFIAVGNCCGLRSKDFKHNAKTTHLRASMEMQNSIFRPADEWVAKRDVQTVVDDDPHADDIPLHTIRVLQETTWHESMDQSMPSPTMSITPERSASLRR